MTYDAPLVLAQALFWIFAAGVAFLPARCAFFCFLVASHLDITSLSFTSATSVGLENTVRIAVLPLLLLSRTGFATLREMSWTLPHKLWLALVVYAAIAAAWSGFALSAFKMVVYLCAYFVLYAVFCDAWTNRWLDVTVVRMAAWCVIGLAAVQTFLLENAFGAPEDRFTSFSSPQYFAACLVAMLAILIFSGERGLFHYATCALILVAIVASGSRYVLISTVALLVIACFKFVADSHQSLRWKLSLRKALLTFGLIAAGIAALFSYLPSNRIDELVSGVTEDDAAVQDVGTFAWRLGIYAEILTKLQQRDAIQLLFGSGTSSGAAFMIDFEPAHYDLQGVDGNRVLHSEFLRALYEWGIVGFTLLCAFLIATGVGFAKKIANDGGGPALTYFGVLPSILIGLAIENILAGAASAGGVGILLAMTFAWSMSPSLDEEMLLESPNSSGSLLCA